MTFDVDTLNYKIHKKYGDDSFLCAANDTESLWTIIQTLIVDGEEMFRILVEPCNISRIYYLLHAKLQ